MNSEEPVQQEEVAASKPPRYYGDDAVREAARYYNHKGILSPNAIHILKEEGFVPGVYPDSKGIDTEGVGQTGDMIGKNFFTEVLPVYEMRAARATKDFVSLPNEVQGAIVSMAYRGDWGDKTKEHLKRGDWKAAADEYLNHNEYRKGISEDATDAQKSIAERMERNAEALRNYAEKKKK